MLQLETYKGTKSRHTCPSCGKRNCFVRYVGDDGNYIDETVGRCNRESTCSYHRKPREFFADNSHLSDFTKNKVKKKPRPNYGFTNEVRQDVVTTPPKTFDYIPNDAFFPTLANYGTNNFVSFLLNLFPEDTAAVEKAIRDYFVGTYEHTRGNYTCFPSIDSQRRICRAKLIRFNSQTGKRSKGEFDTSSLPAMLKLKDFQYKQIFFGEHLLTLDRQKPVAVVEAEKTAIIASICFPQFVWLGSNSKSWLNAKRLERLSGRQIILYPDADGFGLWSEKAEEARKYGLTVKVSSLIETHATAGQKANGYDLADFLIAEQRATNYHNDYTDEYNAKLQMVLNDQILGKSLDSALDEQVAVMVIDGNLSETEAEYLVTRPDNLRRTVLSL